MTSFNVALNNWATYEEVDTSDIGSVKENGRWNSVACHLTLLS